MLHIDKYTSYLLILATYNVSKVYEQQPILQGTDTHSKRPMTSEFHHGLVQRVDDWEWLHLSVPYTDVWKIFIDVQKS